MRCGTTAGANALASVVYDERLMPEDGRSRAGRDQLAVDLFREELKKTDDVFVFGNRVLLVQDGHLAGEFCVEGLLTLGGRQ
jgi:hypothetical protein